MFNHGGSNHHHVSVEKSFRIKQDDKFFSRLMSKETSMANTSSRVFYYGESSVAAVPFVWEAQPGTPKHSLSETSFLPPLTPPPSYYTNYSNKSNHKRRSGSTNKNNNNNNMFSCIFPRSRKNTHMSPSSSWSSSSSTSSSSSSWSLVYPSNNSSCSIRDRDNYNNHNNNHGSLSFSKLRNDDDDDVGTFSKHKGSNNGFIGGCYPFGSIVKKKKKKKNAILSHEAV